MVVDTSWILEAREAIVADSQYYQKMVEVYKISFTDGTAIYVPENIGESVRTEITKMASSDVVEFGKGTWRIYEIKSIVPRVVRFCELSEWAQHKILENNEETGLFGEQYERFSPELKKWIERLKEGKNISHELKLE